MDSEDSIELDSEEYSPVYFELSELSLNFLEDFFKNEIEVLVFNTNFLQNNGFQYQKDIDFTQLYRFLKVEYNTIYSIDPKVTDALIEKFYRDIEYLFRFYTKFKEKRSNINSVYSNFLNKNGGVASIGQKIFKKDLDNKEIEELDDILKSEFESSFLKEYEEIKSELKRVINTKSYYFDALLWKEARKSRSINDFFKQLVRLNIKSSSDLNIKLFIVQYLNSVDLNHVKNPKWHDYLQKVIKVID